jgi:hypothetical protein
MQKLAELTGAFIAVLALLGFAGALKQPAALVPAPPRPEREDDFERLRRRHRPHFGDDSIPTPAVDFDPDLWFKNIGSRIDGAGMCVFTAAEFMFLQLGMNEFKGFRDWCAAKYPGGGYPSKLAKCVKEFCAAKHIPEPELRQYEGSDPAFVQTALANGWMPGVTLFHSPRYGAGKIYHMTNCVLMNGQFVEIQDNNFKPIEVCGFEEGLRRIKDNGQYWSFVIVGHPAPPPVPW